MYRVGGIADKNNALAAILLRMEQVQRKRSAFPALDDRTQHVIAGGFDFTQKGSVVQFQQPFCFSFFARPDDRTTAVGKRQERQWPAWQKTLPCRLFMIPLATQMGNERFLVIRPLPCFDSKHLAQRGPRTICGDNQVKVQRTTVVECQRNPVFVRNHFCNASLGQNLNVVQ